MSLISYKKTNLNLCISFRTFPEKPAGNCNFSLKSLKGEIRSTISVCRTKRMIITLFLVN